MKLVVSKLIIWLIKINRYRKFAINAKDSTALKATLNSIFKLFIVYNKLRGI